MDGRKRIVGSRLEGGGDQTIEDGLEDHDTSTSKDDHKEEARHSPKMLKQDFRSILLLLFLYVLQGIPIGLSGAVPLILQNRKISYNEQAVFSFVTWPFSLKLLWAPIVDAYYSSRIGRRKSWLIPVQYSIGLFMIVLSLNISWLLGEDNEHPRIYVLTFIFFMLNFLAATQDIAVDGWALTMLSRQNVGYASTCNTVGQTAGYFLGNIVLLALESPTFCNKYLRNIPSDKGVVTLGEFLFFWGIVFFVSTTMVGIFKKEKNNAKSDEEEPELGVAETYHMLYKIIRLPPVYLIIVFLLTCKIGFSITDAATGLKLVEAGVKKEHIALLAVPIVPLQILLPFLISKYITGPRPLDVLMKAFPYRLLFGIIFAVLVRWTYSIKEGDGSFPVYYYGVVILAYGAHQVTLYLIFVSMMAFYARVSDPVVGGTYMTLLNTLSNLGGNWPATLSLWLIDPFTITDVGKSWFASFYLWMVYAFTFTHCTGSTTGHTSCSSPTDEETCIASQGQCVTSIDGYYTLTILCCIFGFVWLRWGRKVARRLQSYPQSAWVVSYR